MKLYIYIYIYIQKPKFLCKNSSQKQIGRNDFIQNISNTIDIEALQFDLKFMTGVKNHNKVDLININYWLNDSDLNKGFIQRLIPVAPNINTENYALSRRHNCI